MATRLQCCAFSLGLTWLLAGVASGSSLTSWWLNYDPELAPAVAKYDDATGKVYYSLCNSIRTPVFAFNESTTLDFDDRYPLLNGTSIAGVGYAYTAGDDNPDIIQVGLSTQVMPQSGIGEAADTLTTAVHSHRSSTLHISRTSALRSSRRSSPATGQQGTGTTQPTPSRSAGHCLMVHSPLTTDTSPSLIFTQNPVWQRCT